MKDVDISVIIPSYNSSDWIIQAIDSTLNQGDVCVETLVIDDGSTDASVEMIRAQRPTVRIIRKSNGGVSSARNVGIENAKGKYIKFLDSDDIIPPGSLEHAFRFAESHEGSIIIGRSNAIGEAGCIYENDAYNIPISGNIGTRIDPSFLLTQATHSSLWVIPRNLISRELRFPESIHLGEEYQFSRLLVRLGRPFCFLDSALSTVRNHSGDRLSRKARETDYLKQLDEIEENANLILQLEQSGSSVPVIHIGRRVWTLGRDCVRFGYIEAAKKHFALALELAGDQAATGRASYRFLAKAFGPIRAERILDRLKRIRRK